MIVVLVSQLQQSTRRSEADTTNESERARESVTYKRRCSWPRRRSWGARRRDAQSPWSLWYWRGTAGASSIKVSTRAGIDIYRLSIDIYHSLS